MVNNKICGQLIILINGIMKEDQLMKMLLY
jgi:hypothetical protein